MNEVVIKPSLREQFLQGWAQCRVIFFSAPCGFGKSTAATALLSNHKTCVFSAEDPEFLREPVPKNVDAIVIDSLPALKDPEDQQTLCAWIRENPELHFVILSRGVLPGWLMPFRFTGLLQLIEARDLLFDRDTVRVFLEKNGCTPTEAEINVIIHDSLGYPLALTALSRLMQNGQPYTPEIVGIVQQEIYHYFEDNIFNRFSMPLRRMLLNIAPFDTFDAELAQMISGDSHINELISIVRHDTTMLLNADAQKYRFWSFFQQFLMWELRQVYTPQEQAAVYSRAGLYYELHEDYEHALECYSRCKDHRRVSEMLIRNAEQHPGVGHYYEMEKYYYAIPKEEILRSPSLMCGMSMLTSLCMDYEASEMWYSALQEYAAPLKKTDTAYKEVRGKLAYLDISLPQRSSKGIAENIGNYFKILTDKSLQTPTFSVTSMLPSLMNGGKDFCSWSKHDELLYKTIATAFSICRSVSNSFSNLGIFSKIAFAVDNSLRIVLIFVEISLACAFNSSLFLWRLRLYTDCRSFSKTEICSRVSLINETSSCGESICFSHRNLYSSRILFSFTTSCRISGESGRGAAVAILLPVISLQSSIIRANNTCMPSIRRILRYSISSISNGVYFGLWNGTKPTYR